MRRFLILALTLAVAPGLALADVVFLKGGGRIEGDVVEQRPDRVVIDVSAGRLTLPRTRIDRMVLGASALAEFRARAARLAAGDVSGWLALASWARENDLSTQSRAALDHVLALDPANAAAHQALGHVFVAGRWLTLDESYRARGYVQFDGTWVRPEERQAMLEERAAYAAERREQLEAQARIREAEARARTAEAEAQRAEADAQRAAAEQQQAEQGGMPYPFGFGGGFGPVFPIDVQPVAPPPPVVVIQVSPQRDHPRRDRPGPAPSPTPAKPARRPLAGAARDH